MESRYHIAWKAKASGRTGKGSKLFDQAEAERLAAELNIEYPGIVHTAVCAGPAAVMSGDLAQGIPQSLPA